jgi:hypothetical protein
MGDVEPAIDAHEKDFAAAAERPNDEGGIVDRAGVSPPIARPAHRRFHSSSASASVTVTAGINCSAVGIFARSS